MRYPVGKSMSEKRTFTFLIIISVLLAAIPGARGQTHNPRLGILTARQIAKKDPSVSSGSVC